MFRAPRSSRSLRSYGLSNGTALKPIGGRTSHRSDEDEDSEGLVPAISHSSRQKLPPLQTPIGTKLMGDENAATKQRKNKKTKFRTETHENPNFEGHLSVSRIQVESRNSVDPNSDDENEENLTRRSNASKNNYYGSDDYITQPVIGRRKKGKKKAQSGNYEEDDGFDTLRLSQHLEDEETIQEKLENKPPTQRPGRVILRKIEGAGRHSIRSELLSGTQSRNQSFR